MILSKGESMDKQPYNYGFNSTMSLLFFLLNGMALIIFFNTLLNGNAIPMYPTPEFTKVEKICYELSCDLDVLSFNNLLQHDWIENSDYLLNQFLVLNATITNLVNNTEESRSYLLEDIHYLLDSITIVRERYNKLYASSTQHPLCDFMHDILQQSKEKLDQLLTLNQEIII